ncbi:MULTISPECIES: hypothetical protein [Bradyrhizobium]|uniref:hypothetical protein n=1 Tax=Bradyrhizobium TaxID=374 RepID=UPI000484C9E4|nr:MULTISPECIES: hypothetical protein [Bradyrhizobium]WLB87508.1 hypothetical protein QIH91_32855 [Bradyrhizobium japonicum USDA 135]GLR94717.1 hypothetical protein GCM10007858_23500 [Bradyrhizobium liaoningense]
MGNAMVNALIAAGVVFAIGYGWIAHLQNRGRRRTRAGAGGGSGADTYMGTSDGLSLGSWFSSDRSGSSTDGGSCSSSDGGSNGGDCGGGDGGGGGGGD